MAKRSGSDKKKSARTERHMIVRDLPDGLREVTVDGHRWIEGPYTPEPRVPVLEGDSDQSDAPDHAQRDPAGE